MNNEIIKSTNFLRIIVGSWIIILKTIGKARTHFNKISLNGLYYTLVYPYATMGNSYKNIYIKTKFKGR